MRRCAPLLAVALALGCSMPGGVWHLPGRPGTPSASVDAGPDPSPAPLAQLSVELWSGYRQGPGSEVREPEHVELLLDMTSSMEARTDRQPPHYMAARESATRLIDALSPDTPVGVRAVGTTSGASCVAPTQLAKGTAGSLGRRVRNQVRALRPRAEGSLSGALESVKNEPNGPLDRTRVVVFTDLGGECGADLCEAGRSLAAAGARLEFVVFGGSIAPSCFADFVPDRPPRIAATPIEAPRPNYRVEIHDLDSKRRGPIIARGAADGSKLAVGPVPVLVVVDMNPPALIGPIKLHPNGHTRVRILDFPALDPPVREWGWDTVPASGAIAKERVFEIMPEQPPAESTPDSKPATTQPDRAVAQTE